MQRQPGHGQEQQQSKVWVAERVTKSTIEMIQVYAMPEYQQQGYDNGAYEIADLFHWVTNIKILGRALAITKITYRGIFGEYICQAL